MRKAWLIGLLMLLSPLAWAQAGSGFSPVFVLQPKAELPEEVKETSGIFFHNGRLWTHNDSGNKPVLYALDTTTFQIVQRITLAHVKNTDWEDVCTDGKSVFVGDIGNNKGNRINLKILTFPLSSIPDEGDATVEVDSINFRFGDQTDFKHKKHRHDYDCESMFATDSNLYLFSKGWATGTTRLYRLPKTPGNHVAEVVNGFDSQGLITGADFDKENHILTVVGYVKNIWKPFMYLIYDFDEAGVHLDNRRFEMPQLTPAQTEGICFFGNGRCYVSAETMRAKTAKVWVADLRKWVDKELKNKQK